MAHCERESKSVTTLPGQVLYEPPVAEPHSSFAQEVLPRKYAEGDWKLEIAWEFVLEFAWSK
jgi:hypothetical protein